MFVSKVGNPCPTLGELLASRILYALLVEEPVRNHQVKILYTELLKSWSTLGQSAPTLQPMGNCKDLPYSSPLAIPEVVNWGFPKGVCFCEGRSLNTWGCARTGCNNSFCVFCVGAPYWILYRLRDFHQDNGLANPLLVRPWKRA